MSGRAHRRAWTAAAVVMLGAGAVLGGCEGGGAGADVAVEPAATSLASIAGRVTTADATAVPTNAVVEVRLDELPAAEGSPGAGVRTPVIVGVRRVERASTVPVFFVLVYDPAKISAVKTYAVSASIVLRGRVRWSTPQAMPVATETLKAGGKIVLPADLVVNKTP
jgi:uncharacterized lipoprotein YbaY